MDKDTLVIGSKEGSLCIVEGKSGKILQSFELFDKEISSVALSNNTCQYLAIAEAKKRIILMETDGWKIIAKNWTYHNARITSVDFSPDNKFLMSASLDNFVYFWNL